MSFSSDLSCPSCGMAVEGVSAHTRSLQCPGCANWIYLSANGWIDGGSFEHAIDAPSILHVGRSGSLVTADKPKRAFVVAGRIRVSYVSGYWDEWWLEFEDASHQWLEESDGSYEIHSSVELTPDTDKAFAAKVGSNLQIQGQDWFVTERLEAEVAGTEGRLPVAITPAEKLVCIDLMGNGKEISIEVSGLDLSITQSRVISASALDWD